MSMIKATLRKVLPTRITAVYDDLRYTKSARRNRAMTTEQIFTEIYAANRWGGTPGTFFSGLGSHDTGVVTPYVRAVTQELARLGAASMTAVDLGCGDFSVGRQLAAACGRYIGVDIVKELVDYNQVTYGTDAVSFRHMNMIADSLPDGELCFVRQVLQHLSNEQIAAVLPKLDQFRWCFITEHQPSAGLCREPNMDKAHGDDVRVSRGSGVFLDRPPFDVGAERLTTLVEVPGTATSDGTDAGVVRTYLLRSSSRR